jgi:hypothetical protein
MRPKGDLPHDPGTFSAHPGEIIPDIERTEIADTAQYLL